MRYLLLFFFFTTLHAGDRWDYYIRTHSDIEWAERNETFLTKLTDKISRKFNLNLQQSRPSMVPFESCKWAYSYFSGEQLTPEQADQFIRKVMTETLNEIHRNHDAIIYLTEDVDAKRLPPSLIGLKISFFQKGQLRQPPPFVARIYMDAGKICYNLANLEDNELEGALCLSP